MPSFNSTELSPYSPRQLFDLVADIERYPEFLPWCRGARVLEREGPFVVVAELIISFAHFTERYTSRVILTSPSGEHAPGEISVVMVKGPFEHLTNDWKFVPQPDGGTWIELALDFKFSSRLLEGLIGTVFQKATMKMTGAFKERAEALYGAKVPSLT